MARTYRDLWPQVVAWDNLLLAYRRCRRRKRFTPAAARFHFQWESELLRLQQELASGAWRPGPYHNFRIRDPKPRLISAAPFRDRIVHHAVVNVMEPLYERRFIHDSYACRRGKGTHRAVRRAQFFLQRYTYFLKTDIVRFFPNVDHSVLLGVLRRTITDPELDRLLSQIIARRRRRLQYDCRRHRAGFEDVRRSLNAWLGHCRHANSVGILRALWRRVRFGRRPLPPCQKLPMPATKQSDAAR